MTSILKEKKRDVIPRWRDFRVTAAIGELVSTSKRQVTVPEDNFIISKIQDWKNEKSIITASELITSSFVSSQNEIALEAAEFILNRPDQTADSVRSIARRIIDPNYNSQKNFIADLRVLDLEQIYLKIHLIKKSLRDIPFNPIAYVDLARLYTLLDQRKKAEKAVETALKLNSENRFILRSAARFFVHIGELNLAHKILRRAELTRYDPWLLAAEIAVASAAENSPRFAKTGEKLLLSKNHAPSQTTELAAALGVLEINNGKNREGKKLFKEALVSPTENTVAQAEWVSQRILPLDFANVNEFENVPLKHEAQAWEHYHLLKWEEVITESWKWFYDQPFSIRPVLLGGHIAAAVLGNYEESIKFIKQSLVSNPDDHLLLNNLAFAYASLNQTAEAQKALEQIDFSQTEGDNTVAVTATRGLLAFRFGRIKEGRALYLKAIEMSYVLGDPYITALAKIFYAREELLAKTEESVKAYQSALEASRKISEIDIPQIIKTQLDSIVPKELK